MARIKRDSRHVLGYEGLPKYVFHPELESPDAGRAVGEGLTELLEAEGPPSPAGEIQLFKAMHYFAWRAWQARGKRTVLTANSTRWVRRRTMVRDHLIQVNLGLSYEMLRKTRFTNVDEDDLFSEGLRALCDAVEAFDPWRGYRFSTYACNSIYRGFLRLSKSETRRSRYIAGGFDPRLDPGTWEMDPTEWDERVFTQRLREALENNTANLTSLEQYILTRRFPEEAGQKRDTLEHIGKEIHISKERVRQIQVTALEKLRCELLAEPTLNEATTV